MGFLDRILGREPQQQPGAGPQQYPPPNATPAAPDERARTEAGSGDDERAIARYRYLLRTAPPEALEQVHAEAFARLTPEQRGQVLAELSRDLPPGERPAGDDPQSLARTATRAELRQPGYLEQTFGRSRFGGMGMSGVGMGGMGMGGTILGSMMGTIAGVVVGSAIADALFDGYSDSPEAAQANDTDTAGNGTDTVDNGDGNSDASDGTSSDGTTAGDTGSAYADAGYSDPGYGGSDATGGDYGGGDFGGGDMGGGDFGGGDFGGGGF